VSASGQSTASIVNHRAIWRSRKLKGCEGAGIKLTESVDNARYNAPPKSRLNVQAPPWRVGPLRGGGGGEEGGGEGDRIGKERISPSGSGRLGFLFHEQPLPSGGQAR